MYFLLVFIGSIGIYWYYSMNEVISTFLFFLPAGVANMVPVLVAKMPVLKQLNMPLDFGLKLRNRRMLGDHKTVRGLVLGVIGGIIVALFLSYVAPHIYSGVNVALVGLLLSFGALLGDSVKSFFKRQFGISSGASWFPFDQIDYIIGGLLLSLFVAHLSIKEYITIFLFYFLLHLLISFLGFLLHLKDAAI